MKDYALIRNAETFFIFCGESDRHPWRGAEEAETVPSCLPVFPFSPEKRGLWWIRRAPESFSICGLRDMSDTASF